MRTSGYRGDTIQFDQVAVAVVPLAGQIDAIELQGPTGTICTVSYVGPSGTAAPLDLITMEVTSGTSEVFLETADYRAGFYKFNLTALPSGTANILVAHRGD